MMKPEHNDSPITLEVMALFKAQPLLMPACHPTASVHLMAHGSEIIVYCSACKQRAFRIKVGIGRPRPERLSMN